QAGGRAAARAGRALPRRADDRPRRAVEARRARVREAPQSRARGDGAAHDARHAGRRGARRARHRDRPRPCARRRAVRRSARRRARDARRVAFDRGSHLALLRAARRGRSMSVAAAFASVASARPYVALFRSRFQLMLQYRGAAVAGFITQCWWGGLKIMIFAAFYGTAAASGNDVPLTLAQTITYTWVAQALFAMLPWAGDPDVARAVRTGAVSYDRLRPLDFYGIWYWRAAGWIAARLVPRTLLMLAFAALVLPLAGFERWAW